MAVDKRESVFSELQTIARTSNNQISYKQIMTIIEAAELDLDQTEKILDKLEEANVEIIPDPTGRKTPPQTMI